MTNLFLLGALTCAYGSNRLLGKVVFAVGLWRLFALGLLCGSPFFNRVEVFLPGTLFAYGAPMLIFAFCAFKTNGNIRDNFVRMAALMSFILVSAVLTLAFYRRLYLPGIRFDDGMRLRLFRRLADPRLFVAGCSLPLPGTGQTGFRADLFRDRQSLFVRCFLA